MRAAAIPPILLAAAALAPGGCGTASKKNLDKFKGRQHDVARTVYDFRDAAQRRDAKKVCDSYLSTELKAKLAQLARVDHRGTDCADQVSDSLRDADSYDITVESVAISGNTATVQIKTDVAHGTDRKDTLQLVDQQGWRLSSLT